MTAFRVAIAMSGGVDSAVAAALLKERGGEVIGVHLRFCGGNPQCGGGDAEQSARAVAKHLDIPLVVWDLRGLFRQKVIDPFFKEYRKGKTPSPCTVCNREIKFGAFLDKALTELKVSKVATGHYARLARSEKQIVDSEKRESIGHKPLAFSHKLLQGVDEQKDQSYFLWTLTQEKLQHILFPIGEMTREEVEAKAKKLYLPCASRPKSQGICFVGSEDITRFLRGQLPVKKGPVKNLKGEVIGEHDGVWFYTEGQRHGFRIKAKGKGQKAKVILPSYVIKKEIKTNTLIVGRGKESEVSVFTVANVNWISPGYRLSTINNQLSCGVRIRHLGEILPAKITPVTRGALVALVAPTRGVAPGQSAVFYSKDEVLGGGVIEEIKSQN